MKKKARKAKIEKTRRRKDFSVEEDYEEEEIRRIGRENLQRKMISPRKSTEEDGIRDTVEFDSDDLEIDSSI
jgi:hypothetical protein